MQRSSRGKRCAAVNIKLSELKYDQIIHCIKLASIYKTTHHVSSKHFIVTVCLADKMISMDYDASKWKFEWNEKPKLKSKTLKLIILSIINTIAFMAMMVY